MPLWWRCSFSLNIDSSNVNYRSLELYEWFFDDSCPMVQLVALWLVLLHHYWFIGSTLTWWSMKQNHRYHFSATKLLTTILNMNISFCTAVVPELLLRFGDIVVKQIFNYECRPISVSTAYLLTLRSTGVQEGSRKRTFYCNAALPVSMQWSIELCWIERGTKDIKQEFAVVPLRLRPDKLCWVCPQQSL